MVVSPRHLGATPNTIVQAMGDRCAEGAPLPLSFMWAHDPSVARVSNEHQRPEPKIAFLPPPLLAQGPALWLAPSCALVDLRNVS